MQFARKLSERMSRKQSSWNLSIFLFFSLLLCFLFFVFVFYQKVSEFIKFRIFLKVLYCRILGWIFFQLNFLGRTSVVDFHLFLLLFLGEVHSWSEWRNPSAGLSFRAFGSGPQIRSDALNSSSKRGSHFLVPHCLELFLPSPLRPNQVPHVVSLIFFLKNKLLCIPNNKENAISLHWEYIFVYLYIFTS